jgi:peptide deformylase
MAKHRKGFARPDDPVLLKKAAKIPVGKITSKPTREIINKMLSYAYPEQGDKSKPVLVGLAAPQVKIAKRIILVDVGADGHGEVSDLRVYVNPEITWSSKEKEEWYEGCYSTERVCGIVTRPKTVKIKAYTKDGKKIEERHSGYVARIFQHEIDHLNGKEFVTHIKDDDKLHWVEDEEFPAYRNDEGWRNWSNKCSRKKWEKIKGIKK